MINFFLGCIWKWVSTTWWLYVFIRNMMIRSIVKFWEYSWFLHKVWLGQASDDDHREQKEGGDCFDWHQQGAGRVFIDERRLGEEVQDEARHHVAFNGLTVRTVYKGRFLSNQRVRWILLVLQRCCGAWGRYDHTLRLPHGGGTETGGHGWHARKSPLNEYIYIYTHKLV